MINRLAGLLAVPLLATVLVACGGGGSGGGGAAPATAGAPATTAPVPTAPVLVVSHLAPTLVFNEASSLRTAAHAHVTTQSLARVLDGIDYLIKDLSLTNRTSGFNCSGGSVSATFVDVDRNDRLTAGDRIDMVMTTCPGFWLANGTMTLVVTRVDREDIADADVTLNAVTYDTLAFTYGITPKLTGVLHITSSTDTLLVSASNVILAFSQEERARLSNVNLEYGQASSTSLGITGGLDINYTAGPDTGQRAIVDIDGMIAGSSYANASPGPGKLIVKGSGNAVARLHGSGFSFVLDKDLNGDGSFESSDTVADTALFGAL